MPVPAVNDLFSILPALVLSLFGCAVLLLRFDSTRASVWMLTVGEVLAGIALWRQAGFLGLSGFSGAVLVDSFGLLLNATCLVAALLSAWGAYAHLERISEDHPEFYALLLLAQSGMYLMISGTELITVFIGLELAGICLYTLTGFHRNNPRSNEAALKYVLLGALSSGLLLYGMSILYGLSGSTHYARIGAALANRNPTEPLVLLAVIPLVLGLLFKVAAAPLHFWAPDAYDGAPTPATAFLATASKAASFGLLLRLLLGPLHDLRPAWEILIIVAALASLTLGNLAALTQSSAKRLLAWSSVGHSGYLLLGLVAGNRAGIEAILVYLFVYMLMTTGAFLLLGALEREGVTDFRGLLWRHPGVALMLAVLLVSLAGLPPTAGFIAKYAVFFSLVQARQYVYAVVAAVYVAVSLYYYFRILREMATAADQTPPPLRISPGWRAAVGLGTLLTLALGLNPEPLLLWARSALR